MFEAGNDAEIDVVYQTRLVRFGTVVLFGREALERAGVQIAPDLDCRAAQRAVGTV